MEDVKTGKRSWGLSLEVFVRLLTLVLVLEGVMMLEFAMMFVVILGFESLFFSSANVAGMCLGRGGASCLTIG